MIKSDSNILRDLSWITIITNGGIRDSANVGDVTVKIMRVITIKMTAMTDLFFSFVISRICIAAFDTKSCKLPLKWHCACAFHFGAQLTSYLYSLRRVSQLVNKSLSAAGISEDNTQG